MFESEFPRWHLRDEGSSLCQSDQEKRTLVVRKLRLSGSLDSTLAAGLPACFARSASPSERLQEGAHCRTGHCTGQGGRGAGGSGITSPPGSTDLELVNGPSVPPMGPGLVTQPGAAWGRLLLWTCLWDHFQSLYCLLIL
ncbi:hypothetical protein AAFF_G00229860 [Aldrovandia affinis]|uniref:Uncharacterized protein n=1 Tax=Aldrovandia affinis TaxID=143900 RepID=A0AAD7SVS0_9TELE|nr:hypothetical protein AAFF_G00229860 [Aldrovandia affinis]